jgi:hypothetical protein
MFRQHSVRAVTAKCEWTSVYETILVLMTGTGLKGVFRCQYTYLHKSYEMPFVEHNFALKSGAIQFTIA